jgi:hypothetical protein
MSFWNLPDTSGLVHFLAYADASNGTTASTIRTDYVEIVAEFDYRVHRGVYTDYTPQPLASVEYYVNSISTNGTYAASDTESITPDVAHTQLSSLIDTGKYATLQKGTKLQHNKKVDSSKMKFAGREFPMVEFGDGKESIFDFSYLVFTWDELQTMEELADSGETLLLRDSSGRKAYVALDGMSVTEHPTYWEISVKPEKVYYVEGV